MSVCELRRYSVSSATTRSLSSFFTASPPRNDSSPHTGGLAEEVNLVLRSASTGLLTRRAPASCLRRRAVELMQGLLVPLPPVPRRCRVSARDRHECRGPSYS